ncbi:hypothetical protein Nepgr_001043 [Nepenthes gracilis]|uniref:Uncharacterized protein n=1 Tax=Nepenthes gracilis TaxID=150966 RepID=A0AAD3P3T5_NEPGR|nr:hypothetical protein Nepgr_001043 [Nepenthes gracilis]
MGNPISLDAQISSIENPLDGFEMDGLVSHDTVNTCIDPDPPESSVTTMSNEEIMSNKNSYANLPLQLSHAEFGIHVAVSCDLDEVSTCSKTDTGLFQNSKTSSCPENMVSNTGPQGTFNESPNSNPQSFELGLAHLAAVLGLAKLNGSMIWIFLLFLYYPVLVMPGRYKIKLKKLMLF